MKKLLFSTLCLFIFAAAASAQFGIICDQRDDGRFYITGTSDVECPNTIVTAVPFLRIAADARSGALGDAGIGTSPDANSVHFNDSKLVFADKTIGVSATYTPWLRALGLNDVSIAYLTAYTQLDDLQTLGFGLRYFSLGDIAFTDENGQSMGNGRPNEYEIKASYSRKLSDNFSAGLGAKFIYSNLASGQQVAGTIIEAGKAFGADISFTYRTPISIGDKETNLMAGLAVTNIGSKITYTNAANDLKDFIPTNLGIGAGWEFQLDDFNSITFVADINKLLVPTPCLGTPEECDQGQDGIADWRQESPIGGIFTSFSDSQSKGGELRELYYSTGIEYWYDKQFAVRAGYYYEHQTKGARNYFTVGLGLKYNIFGLNFSYLVPTSNQRNPLDNTLRFSLLFDFGAFEAE